MSAMGRGLVAALSLALLIALVVLGWMAVREPAGGDGEERATRFICPMHPQIVKDAPGSCPICGMDLVPAEGDTGAPGEEAEPAAWVCPMHPQIVKDAPGSCPICGMDLVPAEGDEEPGTAEEAADPVRPESSEGAPAGEGAEGADDASGAGHGVPEGLARVRLTAAKQASLGARLAPVARKRFEREVRASGIIAVDETRLRQVHTKIAGWVERLHADAVGDSVSSGQPLLEIYSPELVAAQEEYLVALRAGERLGQSALPEVADTGGRLLESARTRLRLLDMTEEQIRALEVSGRAERTVSVASPISGTILRREVTQGARVEPATMLLEVADLSRVWLLAAIFEYELPFVREGQEAVMTLPWLPGRSFTGRVTKIYPSLDPGTRTVRVRVEFPNPDRELRLDMFAEVRILGDLGVRLAVPGEAVMETGTRSIVFVGEGEGVFAPREISTGVRLPGLIEVLSGLDEGEMVLASGNFFVDSESKLRAALESASRPGKKGSPSGHVHKDP